MQDVLSLFLKYQLVYKNVTPLMFITLEISYLHLYPWRDSI